MSTVMEAELKDLLRVELKRGSYKLSSGIGSTTYLDARKVALSGQGSTLIGDMLIDLMWASDWHPSLVGGMETSSIPVACAMSHRGRLRGYKLDTFFCRCEMKKHGNMRKIEGPVHLGEKCVIVDDVATTGTSLVKACNIAMDRGLEILGVMCVVDREQGAAKLVENTGFELKSLFTLNELQDPDDANNGND